MADRNKSNRGTQQQKGIIPLAKLVAINLVLGIVVILLYFYLFSALTHIPDVPNYQQPNPWDDEHRIYTLFFGAILIGVGAALKQAKNISGGIIIAGAFYTITGSWNYLKMTGEWRPVIILGILVVALMFLAKKIK